MYYLFTSNGTWCLVGDGIVDIVPYEDHVILLDKHGIKHTVFGAFKGLYSAEPTQARVCGNGAMAFERAQARMRENEEMALLPHCTWSQQNNEHPGADINCRCTLAEMHESASMSWEDARNKDEEPLDYQNSPGYWKQYMSGYYGDSCGGRGSCSSSGACSGSGACKDKKELPCTCSDEQYDAGCATGKGFSDTCPYHTEWAKERLRKERGL